MQVHDVLGTEVGDLESIPGQIRAIILLLPKDEIYKEFLEQKNSDVGVFKIYHTQKNKKNWNP